MAGLVRGAVPRGAGDAIARVPRIVAAIKIVILRSRGTGDVSRLRREGRRRRSRSTQRVRSRRRRVTFASEKAGVRRARGRPRRRARAHLVPDHVSHVAGARHDPQKARGRDHPVRRARGLWHLHTCVSTLYRVKHSTSPPRVRLFRVPIQFPGSRTQKYLQLTMTPGPSSYFTRTLARVFRASARHSRIPLAADAANKLGW